MKAVSCVDQREKRRQMIRVDGHYLYQLGYCLHPVSIAAKADTKIADAIVDLYVAQGMLEGFLSGSVYSQTLKTAKQAGHELLTAIKRLSDNPEREEPINTFEAYDLTTKLAEFETILKAELALFPTYLVEKKRGYDISDLIDNGWVLFPEDLPRKVPESIVDIIAGTRCIAFELNTAAGFHLHRANESVVHKYYDEVTFGAPRPESRNLGNYLAELDRLQCGDAKVKSCLRDLKDLHRNPLIHPEDSLESVDEAVALLGIVHSAIVQMLKVIPDPVRTESA